MSICLKSTKQQVFVIPSVKVTSDYNLVLIPFTAKELLSSKKGHKGHLQIVKKSNLEEKKD